MTRQQSFGSGAPSHGPGTRRATGPGPIFVMWIETRAPMSCRRSRQAEHFKNLPQVGIEGGSASQIAKSEAFPQLVSGGRLPVFRPLRVENSWRISYRELSCLAATVEARQHTFEVRSEKDESQICPAHGIRGVAAAPPVVLQPISIQQDQRVRESSVPGRTPPIFGYCVLRHTLPVTSVTKGYVEMDSGRCRLVTKLFQPSCEGTLALALGSHKDAAPPWRRPVPRHSSAECGKPA